MNRQKALVQSFLGGATSGKASALWIDGDTLYSYAMPIAARLDDGRVAVATRKRSVTTSRHQNAVRNAVPARMLVEVATL